MLVGAVAHRREGAGMVTGAHVVGDPVGNGRAGLCIDEGALSFVISTYCIYMDSPYKLEWENENDKRPSSKQAEPFGQPPSSGTRP